MIDSNNQFKKLSADLVAAARSIMEKKTNKHGHDAVGHEDSDIDNDGDVDASDKYLHNRRKAIAKNMKKEEVEQIDELSKKTLATYAIKAKNQMGRDEARAGYQRGIRTMDGKGQGEMERAHDKRAEKRSKGIDNALNRLAKEETQIDEALDAAARYGDHHTAIKSLLKSISQHVENHKTDAHKHKDYRGKKGVHWGHVGDLAQVHSQLADIHDRLAQQGEYKKSMSESVEDLDIEQIDELSTSTLQSYRKKARAQGNAIVDKMKMGGGDWSKDQKDTKTLRKRAAGAQMSGKTLRKRGESLKTEEVEDLEELSKATMASYVKKAADDFQKRKPKMGYDGQLKKMQNRKVGVNRALDKMYGEEVELDEAPVDGVAAGSMENGGHLCATKVFHKEWAEGTPIFSQHAEPDAEGNIAWYDVMFEHGIEKRVMTEDLEILMSESHGNHKRKMKEDVELDEARGRPRKNPLPAGKESEEPEPRQHIIQQLQRAKLSMRGGEHVTFKDGTKHHVHGQHAAKLLGKYSDMKPYEKEAFQKKIGQSHANLKSEL
jgi:hypothetical protein